MGILAQSCSNRPLDDHAADVAALHLASGDRTRAFAALALGVRGRKHVGERARGMLAQCVAAEPGHIWRALAIAGSAGSLRDRIAIGRAVVAARIRAAEAARAPERTRAPG